MESFIVTCIYFEKAEASHTWCWADDAHARKIKNKKQPNEIEYKSGYPHNYYEITKFILTEYFIAVAKNVSKT